MAIIDDSDFIDTSDRKTCYCCLNLNLLDCGLGWCDHKTAKINASNCTFFCERDFNAYVWDIDGVITQTHNSLNIKDVVSVEEATRRIKSATPYQATIDMIKNLMTQAPNTHFMALTGRKRSQFAEYTEEFFRVQGIEMDVIYYPEHEEHTPEIYYEFKRQELDKLASKFQAIHYFEDDANMVKYLRSNLKHKDQIKLWLIQ